jgi:hypothetical protein
MIDLADLQEMVDWARTAARQARDYDREARARASLTTQAVHRASHRARMAYLKLSMPEANPLTLAITVTILAGHGLLDEKPILRPTQPAMDVG